MTSISTALGMLPIALGHGAGGEQRAPLGIVIIGGVLTSTLLTLVVIPVFYTLWDDLKKLTLRAIHWVQAHLKRPAPVSALTPPEVLPSQSSEN